MYSKFLSSFILLSSFATIATACEGECIVAITKAFLGNYTKPVDEVFSQLANQISQDLVPPEHRPSDPLQLIQPLIESYVNTSYNDMETAIFPSYFHGKCQRFSKDGQDPPGCPNPDCPVVCGTPGSMVHFYSTLRYIAFESTVATLRKLSKPSSHAYKSIEENVKRGGHVKRGNNVHTRRHDGALTYTESMRIGSHFKRSHSRHFTSLGKRTLIDRQHQAREPSLASILSQFDPLLAKTCGGKAENSTDALPNCSWETDMKAYILSFP